MDLVNEPGDVAGCRRSVLEPRLILLGRQQVRGQLLQLGEGGLLEYLGKMGPDDDWSDIFEPGQVFALILGERHEPALLQVVWDTRGMF